jgi:serine protease AprX
MGMAKAHPANVISNTYFKMSGTSVSAPMVSGAVAILLQSEPGLNPDQVKYRLMSTANKNWNGYNAAKAGAGYLDVFAAIKTPTTDTANTNTLPSQLLTTGSDPITWGSIGWNSIGWNSIGWNSIGWNSIELELHWLEFDRLEQRLLGSVDPVQLTISISVAKHKRRF